MIKRIVKMTFREEETETFLDIFDRSSARIRAFEGCLHLELWRCKDPDNIFFTYSYWTDEAALDAYRNSDLFRETWRKTKALFAAPPEAGSVEVVEPTNEDG